MLATKINNHVQAALARLLQQYKGQPRIEAMISSFVEQIQDIENAMFDLDAGRQIANAVGAQLDGIGEIVGFPRNGLDDMTYLVFLYGKIGENTSDTTKDKIINIALLVFISNFVLMDEIPPAAVGLEIGSPGLDPSLFVLATELVAKSLGGGIGLGFLATYDSDDNFSYLEAPDGGDGYADLSIPDSGGTLATLVYNNMST